MSLPHRAVWCDIFSLLLDSERGERWRTARPTDHMNSSWRVSASLVSPKQPATRGTHRSHTARTSMCSVPMSNVKSLDDGDGKVVPCWYSLTRSITYWSFSIIVSNSQRDGPDSSLFSGTVLLRICVTLFALFFSFVLPPQVSQPPMLPLVVGLLWRSQLFLLFRFIF